MPEKRNTCCDSYNKNDNFNTSNTTKKIILAFIGLLSFGVAVAQLEVSASSPRSYSVYPMRAGVSLNYTRLQDGSAYYYLQLNPSNRFDGAIYIWLGSREQALATLKQLLFDLYTLDESYLLKDRNGESFTALCSSVVGAKGYTIFKSGYAGYAYVRLSQIEKMIELL